MHRSLAMDDAVLAAALLVLTAIGLDDLGGQPEKMSYSKQTIVYKTVGECRIHADVYRMPGDDVRPAILWIHGGALIVGSRENIRTEQLKRYLDAGFAVVSMDYRLAPETK